MTTLCKDFSKIFFEIEDALLDYNELLFLNVGVYEEKWWAIITSNSLKFDVGCQCTGNSYFYGIIDGGKSRDSMVIITWWECNTHWNCGVFVFCKKLDLGRNGILWKVWNLDDGNKIRRQVLGIDINFQT